MSGVVVEQPPQPGVLRDQPVDEGERRTGGNGGNAGEREQEEEQGGHRDGGHTGSRLVA